MRGVSEVLGEALLLVIVVLLSSLLAMEAGSIVPLKQRPMANFLLVKRDGNYTIIHEEGDSLPISELRVTVYNGTGFYVLNASKLVKDLNGNGMWDIGEYMNVSSSYGRAVITIAEGGYVICRLHT